MIPGLVSLDQGGALVEGFQPEIDLRSTKEIVERSDGHPWVATEWGTDDVKGLAPSLLL